MGKKQIKKAGSVTHSLLEPSSECLTSRKTWKCWRVPREEQQSCWRVYRVNHTTKGWRNWGCSAEERRLRGDLLSLQHLRGDGGQSLLQVTSEAQEGMALSCASLDTITASVVKRWKSFPGNWWSHCAWMCSRKNWARPSVLWFCWQGGAQSKVGLVDLGALFQPQGFHLGSFSGTSSLSQRMSSFNETVTQSVTGF